LLDRFALRLQASSASQTNRAAAILNWLDREAAQPSALPMSAVPTSIPEQLRQASQRQLAFTTEAIDRIFHYITVFSITGSRRELALARLARAIAQLYIADQVRARHIDAAARLIDLRPITPQFPETEEPEASQSGVSSLESPISDLPAAAQVAEPTQSRPFDAIGTAEEKVIDPGMPETRDMVALSLETGTTPWPEDNAPVEREAASLRLPMRRYRATTAERGIIIGVQRADKLQDLALVSTILEAAKYQIIRHIYNPDKSGEFLIWPTDLRRYRRIPGAEQMLVLVLDYTCLRDCDWRTALFPHLRWAYVERAPVCLIQVGAAVTDSTDELRAQKVTSPSILTPRVGTALEAKAGRATPLAHGLDLARQTLQSALMHGRNPVQRARLVVISDGRGNIPLQASRIGQLKFPVNRQGIDDALYIANRLRSLKRVQSFLLDPQPQQHPELPTALANALGAMLVAIPLTEEVAL